MAFSSRILCFLLLCFYYSSLLTHARDNQFFSKFSPYNTNTNNVEDNAIPPKKIASGQQESETEPTFTPENHNGHGLYGREIDQGTRFTYSPEKHSYEFNNGGQNSEYMFNNGNPFNNRENNLYENRNTYGYDETKQNNLYGNNEVIDYNKNMNRFPVQRQGMSDTRFLENGKYFYDLNNEELSKNRYHNQIGRNNFFGPSSYRGENSRVQYNNQDENLYGFNNYMENNNQGSQEGYVP